MGFATPSVAHHLTNPYDEDLVYLMGGERSRVEVSSFPRAGKRIIFSGSGIWQVDEKDLRADEPRSMAGQQLAGWRGLRTRDRIRRRSEASMPAAVLAHAPASERTRAPRSPGEAPEQGEHRA